jgi:hypothetical protein
MNEAANALQQLAQDYWEGTLRRNPTIVIFNDKWRDLLKDI